MTPAREALLAAAGAALGAVLFVAPWRPNPRTVPLTYPPGAEVNAAVDAVPLAFAFAWTARNLRALLAGPDGTGRSWFDAPVLHPAPTPLAMMDHRLTEGVWAAPIFLRLEPLVAWGWLLLATLWIGALAAYAAGRILTGSPWGGAAFAVLHGFGAHQAARLAYSQTLGPPLWIPLLVAALVLFVDSPTRRRAVLLAAAAALTAVEYAYHALHVALLLPLALGIAVARRRVPAGRAAAVLALTALLAAPAVVPAARAYAAFHRATGMDRPEGRVAQASADAWAWLTGPDARLFGLGPRVEPLVPYPGSYLFPGLVAAGLGLAGARALGRRSAEAVAVGLGGFVLTFGTGQRLLWSIGLPPLPVGPYALLRAVVAGRAFGTPPTAAPFAGAVLAAAGALAAARWARTGRRRALVAVLLVASFAEARRAVREADVRPDRADDPAYAWIAERAAADGTWAVLDIPMGRIRELDEQGLEIDAMWSAWAHGRPTPNGTTSTAAPWHEAIAVHVARRGAFPGVADRLVRALGVRYVVARGEEEARPWRNLGLAEAWRSGAGGAGSVVLEIDSPAPLPVSIAGVQEAMAGADHARLTDPRRGAGRIEAPARLAAAAQAAFGIDVVVANDGDETWCADPAIFPAGRDVRVGILAWTPLGGGPAPVDVLGHPLTGRGFLPYDVAPGETAPVRVHATAPPRRGTYRVALGLLVEGDTWFPGAGASVEVAVGSPLVDPAGPINL